VTAKKEHKAYLKSTVYKNIVKTMIKLSKMTDYAVVILAEMASHNGALLSATGLSEKTALPEPTVSKVLKLLTKKDIIASKRGINGGYSLVKMPENINMAEVITALDGPIALTACVEQSEQCCAHEVNCKIKGQWNPVNAAMQKALEDVSLDQMMKGAM
tara:strand:+ start:893 stop:1369 length:477 start_codon:yes stop_codon:yes gene_type:complete